MEAPWTILELAELAAGTLAGREPTAPEGAQTPTRPENTGTSNAPDGAGAPNAPDVAGTQAGRARANGRVRDVPNERLVRWYVTVGLVDPPLSRRGRVARYGRRHLLQLVAVKRRQAEGRSLAEIQAELAGATNETLAAIARVPDTLIAPDAPRTEVPSAPARFWTRQARQPGEPAPAGERAVRLDPVPARERPSRLSTGASGRPGQPALAAAAHRDRGALVPPAGLVHGVRLAPGVTLLLESAGREPGPDDVTEIVHAAQPLLAALASRRLCASGPDVLPDVPGPSSGVDSSPKGAGHDH